VTCLRARLWTRELSNKPQTHFWVYWLSPDCTYLFSKWIVKTPLLGVEAYHRKIGPGKTGPLILDTKTGPAGPVPEEVVGHALSAAKTKYARVCFMKWSKQLSQYNSAIRGNSCLQEVMCAQILSAFTKQSVSSFSLCEEWSDYQFTPLFVFLHWDYWGSCEIPLKRKQLNRIMNHSSGS